MTKARFLLLGMMAACAGPALTAGTLTGTVRARGADDAASVESGSYGSRRFKFVERINYDELTDFFVYIDQPVPDPAPPTAPARATIIRQRDATFVPRILAVPVGTTVEFPNEDEIFHNVFSMSDATPFDLGLYKRGEQAKHVRFDQIGRVDVFCSIHKSMSCIVLVVPSRYVARADERGRWSIAGVPAGTYRVKAWHERMPGRALEVIVPAEGEARADFVLGFGTPSHD